MAQFGQFALTLAFVATAYSIVASLLGIYARNDRLIASGRNAVVGVCVATTAAIVTLGYLFVTNDFSVAYVAGHSNRDLPTYFKIAAIWGGMEGSLLFWGWLLTVYAALVVIQNRRKHMAMMPYVTAVLMGTSLFFTAMYLFLSNPFSLGAVKFPTGVVNLFTPRDGQGLNPSLQDTMMTIHPPLLYIGFVGFAVPYAFAIAALITRQLGDTWIRTTRRWTMAAWGILGTGILLGGFWAYHELGWGGFWAWDPVENASLMPWLIGTAFLHSVMVQEKKGMLKVWNVVLVILCYTMSIFGTFLTRSGFIQSVHAFAQSSVGWYFLGFIVLALSGSLFLLFDRLSYLKSEGQLQAIVSRESSFLFNNLILLAACFAVFWGTVFPVLSSWWINQEVTLKGPWFDSVEVPIAIFLLFLTGVGPLLAWRKVSTDSLKRNLLPPAVVALTFGVVLIFWGIRHFYAWMSAVISVFVAVTIVREFYNGARARAKGTSESLPQAIVNLTLGNTRRYGGYIAHFGWVLLMVGWTGQAFTKDMDFDLGTGESYTFGRYIFRVEKLGVERTPNYIAEQATVGLYEKRRLADPDSSAVLKATMKPEKRMYLASQTPTTEVAIRSNIQEDVYLVLQESAAGGAKARLKAYINPLVMWVWMGGIVVALGTLVALLPNRKTLPARRAVRTLATVESAKPAAKEDVAIETVTK